MEEAAQSFIGEHGWVFLVGIVAIVFNSLISSTAQGVLLWWSKQYQADDIVYVGGREARIVRIGMRETVIYYADTSTKVTIPNENIRGMGIEKKIDPMNFAKK
jgi:small-conductance mechanosensitive channel